MKPDSTFQTYSSAGRWTRWLTAALLLAGATAVTAAGLRGMPAYYPEGFDFVGHIQSVDAAKRKLVIDDQTVIVPRGARISSQQSEKELFSVFREGMRLGFDGRYDRNGRLYMEAAWIIPNTLRLPAQNDEQEDG